MAGSDGFGVARTFQGSLRATKHEVPVTFDAHIDQTGRVVLSVEQLPFNTDTRFILDEWHGAGDGCAYFSLIGSSGDGVRFETEHLYFDSIGPNSDEIRGSYYNFRAGCRRAILRRKAATPEANPSLVLYTRGFKALPQLHAVCDLGDCVMRGDVTSEDPGRISGILSVSGSLASSRNAKEWETSGRQLLDHVRRVMSFAAGTIVTDPVSEFRYHDQIEVTVLLLSSQRQSHSPTFHELDRQGIFDKAVTSFYSLKQPIENLWMALEWFSMEATYNEVRLVNAMTALENIVSSNTRHVSQLLTGSQLRRLRPDLLNAIQGFLEKEVPDPSDRKRLTEELDLKLPELRRRPLKRKLGVLIQNRSIPMNGITETMIDSAISARNDIIHEGRYYVPGDAVKDDLWKHICVIRELVTRIVLTSLGYEGRYISQMGGYAHAIFPPTDDVPKS
jgi:hypothetical protein